MVNGDEQSKDILGGSSSSTNAEARMKFGSVDALSELVWSPRNGLSLRCADFSFQGKPKLLSPNFFDIGQQTNMAILHSNSTSVEEAGFRVVDVQLRTVVNRNEDEVNQTNRPILSGDVKHERDQEMVETNDVIEKGVGSSKRSLDSPRAIEGKERLRLENSGTQEDTTKRGSKEEGDKTSNRVCILDRLESTDENDFATLAVAASKAMVECEGKEEGLAENETDAGPSGSYRRRAKEKGKGKALSDGNFDGGDDDDESFGSVESCNSAGLLSRGMKRPGFEQGLILGSKRLKTLGEECLGSSSKLKQDSSFMNWISNMTKGIWNGNEEDNSPFVALNTTSEANGQVNAITDQCCLKENSKCRNTGFQSFFQSIYCPSKRNQDGSEMDLPNDTNAASLQELPWIPEQCPITKEIGPVVEPDISSGKVGINQTSEAFSSENKHEDKEPNVSLLSLSKFKPDEEEKPVSQRLTNRNSGPESLWISRFSSRSSFPQKQRIINEAAKEANDSASDVAKTRDSQKMLIDNNVIIPSVSKLERFDSRNPILPIVSSLRIESSEAMASMFARRLEALKHIMPSGSSTENTEKEQTESICFYCGKKGHQLKDCLEVTDTELRDLVQNLSARNGREEASSLCIRCFQLSHWAATCPNAPPYRPGAGDRAMKHTCASTSGTKLPLATKQVTYVPKAVYNAVQLLRLTRTDVLRWMNTNKSVSGLEGFFLRLRFGKWEEGTGGTGYHVARIDGGAMEGQSSRRDTENSSICVKVGGMTCFVESQFISNHDFLEEELKAWWRIAGKPARRSGGDGDGIPTEEELGRKIEQRKMLGF